jgi:hypothetical protein
VNILVDKEYGPKKKGKACDKGDFKCIYKGKAHQGVNNVFGIDLTVNGS